MTKDDIIDMYEKANGWSPEGFDKTIAELERFANLVAAAEREACADRAGVALLGADRDLANRVDYAIRERGAP